MFRPNALGLRYFNNRTVCMEPKFPIFGAAWEIIKSHRLNRCDNETKETEASQVDLPTSLSFLSTRANDTTRKRFCFRFLFSIEWKSPVH